MIFIFKEILFQVSIFVFTDVRCRAERPFKKSWTWPQASSFFGSNPKEGKIPQSKAAWEVFEGKISVNTCEWLKSCTSYVSLIIRTVKLQDLQAMNEKDLLSISTGAGFFGASLPTLRKSVSKVT